LNTFPVARLIAPVSFGQRFAAGSGGSFGAASCDSALFVGRKRLRDTGTGGRHAAG